MSSLRFLGAAGTVTGSKFLLETGGHRLLIDCGLFQGLKELRLRNWAQLPVDPKSIDAVVLTHAHVDHTGGLPRLVAGSFKRPKDKQSFVFTGDLGRYQGPLLHSPEAVYFATTLIAESTYGDRLHGQERPADQLADAVNTATRRGGLLVIPAFAIGRTQEILYDLRSLEEQRTIPVLDVFVDSPMARDATPIYLAHPEEHSIDMAKLVSQGISPLRTQKTRFVNSVAESKRLNSLQGPAIIISASGMATGGRVLHHLKHRLPDARNLVLFVGYQAEGTRGRRLLNGEKQIPIQGSLVSVKAEIRSISGFSAHVDWKEMLRWMDGIRDVPKQVFLVHGEASALEGLRGRVAAKGWPATVPQHLETVELKEPS